jgi:uncharacterized delta-60 repeat protein
MSYRSLKSPKWYEKLGTWLLGDSHRKRDHDDGPPESANVEFLEERMVLTTINGVDPGAVTGASSAEHLAPDTSTSTTTNPNGSTTSTSTTTTTNSDGSVTTTITTTTTNADGSTSTSSSTNTTAATTSTATIDTDEALGSAVQSDGKIVVVGFAQATASDATDANNYDFAVTRLNADGSLDTTFGTNGKKTIAFDLGGAGHNQDAATCVVIQPDGKIVVGGYTERDGSGNFDFAIVRLNTDGSLDTTFSNDGKATIAFDYGGGGDDRATCMALQSDGMIVVAGYTQISNGGNNAFALARLTSGGELDQSFTGDGRKYISFNGGDDRAASVAVQADGKIVVAGFGTGVGTGYDFAIARVTANGTLDRSFSADGKKMVGFNLGGTQNDMGSAVAVQSDGSILLGGSVTGVNGDEDFGVTRLKSNGSMDKSFGKGGRKTISFNLGGNNNDLLTAMAVQADGQIVVGGVTQISLSGDYDFAVARLNVDGTLDTSFSTDGKKTVPFNLGDNDADLANSLTLQSDGKIILAGSAAKSSLGNSDFAITRLNDDGSVDTSFGSSGIKTVPFDLT